MSQQVLYLVQVNDLFRAAKLNNQSASLRCYFNSSILFRIAQLLAFTLMN